MPKISDNVFSILTCPECQILLERCEKGALCNHCGTTYETTKHGSLDLRLNRAITTQYDITLGEPLVLPSNIDFRALSKNSDPKVDFAGFDVPYHLTSELLGHFPAAVTNNSLMLDLGCGNTIHRSVCEHAGFEYVGLDHESEDAPILGDAHALPFADNSFEFVLSIAVLEHIRFPFVMMKEVHRVLKPGSTLIGTVAFLESFHGDSYYHHTHLGTLNSLTEGGFEITHIAPSSNWTVLKAQANMALFPKMPEFISTMLITPLQILHRGWWKIGRVFNKKATEDVRIRDTTGAFTFIAKKRLG